MQGKKGTRWYMQGKKRHKVVLYMQGKKRHEMKYAGQAKAKEEICRLTFRIASVFQSCTKSIKTMVR